MDSNGEKTSEHLSGGERVQLKADGLGEEEEKTREGRVRGRSKASRGRGRKRAELVP